LAQMALPPPPPPHPGHEGKAKEYAAARRKIHYKHIEQQVQALAQPRVATIFALPTWQAKQDAVDELFESIEFQLRDAEPILQGHPKFGAWVELALETYLKQVQAQDNKQQLQDGGDAETDASTTEEKDEDDAEKDVTQLYPTQQDDDQALPIFMDCYDASTPDAEKLMVPTILAPLQPHPRDGPGRMVEEWELSAHQTTKRILLRQSTRQIARTLLEHKTSRIFVSGRRGVGKVSLCLWSCKIAEGCSLCH